MSAARHTLQALAALPLPPAQRRDLLSALLRAGCAPPLPPARADALLSDPEAPLPAAVEQALTGPHVSQAIQDALAALTGHRSAAPEQPDFPHPLGRDATFRPRIAELVRLHGHVIYGEPLELPGFPFGGPIVGFREALRRPRPARAIILGGGYIGVELAHGWAAAGSRVALVERRQDLLRGYLPDDAEQARAMLEALGARVLTGHHADGWSRDGDDIVLHTRRTVGEEGRVTGPVRSWRADLLVIAAGVTDDYPAARDVSELTIP